MCGVEVEGGVGREGGAGGSIRASSDRPLAMAEVYGREGVCRLLSRGFSVT